MCDVWCVMRNVWWGMCDEECVMCNVWCGMNYLFRAVLVMAFSIRTIVWQSVMILSNSVDSKYLASWSNSSQYSVSPASFSAIYILAIKSALLCANWASFIFAPMLVPLRSNCLLRTNSLLFETKWRYKHIIRKANDLLNDWTVDFYCSLHTSNYTLFIVAKHER